MFKYKYETVLAVQYVKPNEADIKNRFDQYPSWLEQYIDDNMILNQVARLSPIVLCSSYKDKIEGNRITFGHVKHILKQDDWIVRTMKDGITFCYSDDEFNYLYEKENIVYS